MTEEQYELILQAKWDIKSAAYDVKMGNARAAMSRAYYAMFYIARVFLLDKGLTFSKHSAVISAFGYHFAATGVLPARFHQTLGDAFDLRGEADYDFETPVDKKAVEGMIALAHEFVELAEQHFGSVTDHDDT
jgi:uncharacterized protein (UPF0332 family)